MSSLASLGVSGASVSLGIMNSRKISSLSEQVDEILKSAIPTTPSVEEPVTTNVPGADKDLEDLNNNSTDLENVGKRLSSVETSLISLKSTKDTFNTLQSKGEALSTNFKSLELDINDTLLDIQNLVSLSPEIRDLLDNWDKIKTNAYTEDDSSGNETLQVKQCKIGMLHNQGDRSALHFNGIDSPLWTMYTSNPGGVSPYGGPIVPHGNVTGNAMRMIVGSGANQGFIVEKSDPALGAVGVFSVDGKGVVTAGSATVKDLSSGYTGFVHSSHSSTNKSFAVTQNSQGVTFIGSSPGQDIHLCINGEPKVLIDPSSNNTMSIKNGHNTSDTLFNLNGDNIITTRDGSSTMFRSGVSEVDHLTVNNEGVNVNGPLYVNGSNVSQRIQNMYTRIQSIENKLKLDADATFADLSDPEITDAFVETEVIDHLGPPTPKITGAAGTYSMIRIFNKGYGTALSLAQVEIFDHNLSNIARDPSKVHSVWQTDMVSGGVASRAVDGNISGNWQHDSVTHTGTGSRRNWRIAFNKQEAIKSIRIYNRTDCCSDRLEGATLELWSNSKVVAVHTLNGDPKQNIYLH